MNDMDQFDSESEALQADVMRFMAIIAFSLLIIFIPLIQSLKEETVEEKQQPEIIVEKVTQQIMEKEPIPREVEPVKEEIKKQSEKKIEPVKEVIKQPEKKVEKEKIKEPVKTEKSISKASTAKKGKQLRFGEGAFQELMQKRKIRCYVVIVDHNLCFEIINKNGNYTFSKASVRSPSDLVGLKQSTLPPGLIKDFKNKLSSLASYKHVYCFDPSPSVEISRQLNNIITGKTYGTFTIQANGKIAHEN